MSDDQFEIPEHGGPPLPGEGSGAPDVNLSRTPMSDPLNDMEPFVVRTKIIDRPWGISILHYPNGGGPLLHGGEPEAILPCRLCAADGIVPARNEHSTP